MAFQRTYGCSDEGGENRDGSEISGGGETGRERRLPSLLYADVLVLCGKSEEDLKAMVGRFLVCVEVCKLMEIRAR